MITRRDDSGVGLQGAVDGSNTLFVTTHDMRLDRVVDVFVNGACRMAALDNGYSLIGPRTVQMAEAPLPGDTISVRYNTTPVLLGTPNDKPQGLAVVDVDLLGPPTVTSVAFVGRPVIEKMCPCG